MHENLTPPKSSSFVFTLITAGPNSIKHGTEILLTDIFNSMQNFSLFRFPVAEKLGMKVFGSKKHSEMS